MLTPLCQQLSACDLSGTRADLIHNFSRTPPQQTAFCHFVSYLIRFYE